MLDKNPSTIQHMFARIAPRYDVANRVLSARFDTGWRKRVARSLLPRPGRVLDLAAGTGDLTVDLVRWGGHRVVSADFTFEMLEAGRAKLRAHAGGAPQVCADALSLPFRAGAFDAVTVAFGIRNFADPERGLREILASLRSGGTVGILEFSRPNRLLNTVFGLYFRYLLPLVGGLITGSRQAYEYLPASVGLFPEGREFLDLMERAGARELQMTRLTGGIATFYRGVKP